MIKFNMLVRKRN